MKEALSMTLILLFVCCKKSSDKKDYYNEQTTTEIDSGSEPETGNNSDNNEAQQFPDGTYDATVEYYNPETGYSGNYDIEADVEDDKIVRLNFPKGGWIDDDVHPEENRIYPEEIDENGDATLRDGSGRTFDVHIEK